MVHTDVSKKQVLTIKYEVVSVCLMLKKDLEITIINVGWNDMTLDGMSKLQI